MSQVRPLPIHLSHYPLYFVEYFDHDGKYAGDTNTHYLSLGVSTYSDRDLSLKVWRKGGKDDKWLRKSEELPLHRPIDLVLLLLAVIDGDSTFAPGTLENQPEAVTIGTNPPNPHWVRSLSDYLAQPPYGDETNGDLIKRRLEKLYEKLEDMHSRGMF